MTPIPEIIFSGFVSKVVNDGIDVSKDKIRKAVKDRNSGHQNIESQIYNVIVDVLNKITYNRFEDNQDKIFDVAYALLKSLKENREDDLGIIQYCLGIVNIHIDENGCLEFKVSLYEELGQNEYVELFRAILLLLFDQKSRYDNAVNEQLILMFNEVDFKLDKLNQKFDAIAKCNDNSSIQENVAKFENNKKQDYIKIWNSRLFLHVDNDENPITLADAFIMPDYIYYKFGIVNELDSDCVDEIIFNFINHDRSANMLITGEPGMGKSSIVSWIANKYQDNDALIILRFRNWEDEELDKGLLKAVYNTLKCRKKDLQNRVLILDGFDEIKAVDRKETLLSGFMNEILDIDNIKIIITSRPGYIDSTLFSNQINLLPFGIQKVKRFCNLLKVNNSNINNIDISNLDILGIPVILYMALMSNIDITQNATKPDLYNLIFTETGGIFDKFSYHGVSYDDGTQPMRDKINIRKYMQFLREIAFVMFESNSLVLNKAKCSIPEMEFQGNHFSVLEFPIKHFFENVDNKIEFIHKSIYEYFVAEYVYLAIINSIDKTNDSLAVCLCEVLKNNRLTKEILEFLQYHIIKEKKIPYDFIKEIFKFMLQNGMTHYVVPQYENVVEKEMRIFANMLEVIHLWEKDYFALDISIKKYLKYNIFSGLNLKYVDLEGMNLENVNLRGSDLSETYLSGVNFTGANLENVNLENADLNNAILTGANLVGTKFIKTNLNGAVLNGADLRNATFNRVDLEGANVEGAIFDEIQIKNLFYKYQMKGTRIYLKATNEIISYEKYYKITKKTLWSYFWLSLEK